MRFSILVITISALIFTSACRRQQSEFVTVALPDPFSTLDTLTTTASDSSAERLRNLLFNTLVKKDEKFDYIGELASEIFTSEDGMTLTFKLRDGVKFHNGKDLTAADVKYTFDELFKSKGYKAGAFFDTVDEKQVPHISSLETPDTKSVIIKVSRPALKNQLLANLVTIPIIPEGSIATQGETPIGSGPFKFLKFDRSQNTVEMEGFAEYWDKPTTIKKLRVKTVTDASALQAELQTGAVDIAPLPSNLPPDTLKNLKDAGALNVEQFDGSNIQYIGINTTADVVKNAKIRQALGHAIDREKIVNDLLYGQAKVANSILPSDSWAINASTTYNYDPQKAQALLKEAGYNKELIKLKVASSNAAFKQFSQVIQSSLSESGFNIEIETVEPNALRQQLSQGQFQMNVGVWIGGNQDPIFLKDLFTTARIPGPGVNCCNRSRYTNTEVDKLLDDAINSVDRERASELYKKAQDIINNDVPLLPLWYPANMVVSNKRIGNIKISPSGDWSFIKDITVTQ